MKKQALIGVINAVVGFVIGAALFLWIALSIGALSFLLIPLAAFIAMKLIERFTLPSDKKSRYLSILWPCVIWAVPALVYYFFFDLPSGGSLSGYGILLIIPSVVVFAINAIFETIVEIKNKYKKQRRNKNGGKYKRNRQSAG